YDSLRVEVQLNEAKSNSDDTDDNVLQTHRKLLQLMGLAEDTRMIQGELPKPDAGKIKDLKFGENILANRNDLRALELRAESADKDRKAQNMWFVPSVS